MSYLMALTVSTKMPKTEPVHPLSRFVQGQNGPLTRLRGGHVLLELSLPKIKAKIFKIKANKKRKTMSPSFGLLAESLA